MTVKQIVNTIFTSNNYIIAKKGVDSIWLVDIGNIDGVLNSMSKNNDIKGVFITHPHFDHIYGINKLIGSFPNCKIYTSHDGRLGLSSAKLNLSFYHEKPIEYVGDNISVLKENDTVELFDNVCIQTLETPGHNIGCLSFIINNFLFTGDSYIPNVDVVTKLKGGDKEMSKKSLQKIMNCISNDTIICPGHGEMTNTNIYKTY
ncbi:MAG: MBL fold metallo-hydrolase [Bacteroidales bacterium]|nr:MBL fold metallo-hydrolase [Bacteroidales bacterium]